MVYFTDVFKIRNDLITPHISLKEYVCHHCGKLPIIKNERHYIAILHLFSVFEILRITYGKPIIITSGYRCQKHQDELRRQGLKAAKVSPHTFGVALDIKGQDMEDTAFLYNFLIKEFPNLRLGYFVYNKKFIHMDTAYLLDPNDIPELAKPYWHKGARW